MRWYNDIMCISLTTTSEILYKLQLAVGAELIARLYDQFRGNFEK